MRNPLKILGLSIAGLVALLIITAIAMPYFINPADYQQKIDQYAYEKTGHHLTMSGIKLSVFPWIGANLNNVVISNPDNFSSSQPNFAEIGELEIKVKLIPLLMGDIELGKMIVNQAKINLITNANQKTNWQSLSSTPSSNTTATTTTAIATTVKPKKMIFSVAGITINDSTVNMVNQATGQSTQLTHLNLTVGKIENKDTFPLQLQFVAAQKDSRSTTNVDLITRANFNFNDQIYRFEPISLNTTTNRPGLPIVPTSMKCDSLVADLNKQTMTCPELSLALANMQLNGSLNVTNLSVNPRTALILNSKNTSLSELLKTLQGHASASGSMDFKTNLQTQGQGSAAMVSNLSGNGSLNIDNPVIHGLDLNSMLNKLSQLISLNVPALLQRSGSNSTAFDQLSATYTIKQGVLYNNDLKATSGKLVANGAGTVNLVTNQIRYTLTVSYYAKKDSSNVNISFPIYVSGTIENPSYQPDFSSIMKLFIKTQIKDVGTGLLRNLIP